MHSKYDKSIISALKLVNSVACRSGKKLYLLYIVINLVLVVNTFVALSLTEYTVNSAYHLFTKEESMKVVTINLFLFLLVSVVFIILDIIKNILRNKLYLRVSYSLENEINNKLGSIEWEYYENNDTFVKIHEIKSKTIQTIQQMIDSIVLYITTIPLVCLYGYYILQINGYVVIVYICMFVFFNGVIAGKLYRNIGSMWKELQVYSQRGKYYFSISGDRVSHQEYKFNRLLDFTYNKWNDLHDKEYDLSIKISKKHEISLQSARIIMSIPYILMMIFAVYEIAIGKHEIGFFILINKVLNSIVGLVMNIQNNINSNRLGVRFINSYKEILNLKDEPSTYLSPCSSDISFKEISYIYPNSNQMVLDNLSMFIKAGEKVALVGHNGSGKTTLVNLFMSLTTNYHGVISDGKNEISLRGTVSCILQDFAQYQLTIKENIEIGFIEHSFTDEEIMKILERVGLSELVEKLDKGIYTSLGQLDNGIELSKGQWQRLAIARLMANPNSTIWILDEPTSYLDPISEIQIYKLIYELAEDRTVIFISHRLGFAKNADKIIVLENGQVKEVGNHQTLTEMNRIYAAMYESQKKWYSSNEVSH